MTLKTPHINRRSVLMGAAATPLAMAAASPASAAAEMMGIGATRFMIPDKIFR